MNDQREELYAINKGSDRRPLHDGRLTEIVNDADNFYRPEIKSMAEELLDLRATNAGMLKALKMVLSKMDDWNQDGPTIQQIKAAISKAEGRAISSQTTTGAALSRAQGEQS